MAVYTIVEEEALAKFLLDYDVGPALSFKGIAEGVENSNYILDTERGRYILTLYERRVRQADLPFFLGLMEHLAARGYLRIERWGPGERYKRIILVDGKFAGGMSHI